MISQKQNYGPATFVNVNVCHQLPRVVLRMFCILYVMQPLKRYEHGANMYRSFVRYAIHIATMFWRVNGTAQRTEMRIKLVICYI